MRTWITGLALLCAILVQGCAAPPSGSAATAPAGKAATAPDFGSKAYGY
jgi:hypothetical protein